MRTTDPAGYTAIVFLLLFLILWCVTTALYTHRLPHDLALQKRSVSLTLASALTALLTGSMYLLIASRSVPCFLVVWTAYMGLLPWGALYTARVWRLISLTSNQERIMEYGKRAIQAGTKTAIPAGDHTPARFMLPFRHFSTTRLLVVLFIVWIAGIASTAGLQATSSSPFTLGDAPTRCPIPGGVDPAYAILLALSFTIPPILLFRMGGVHDAFGIRTDLKCVGIGGLLLLFLHRLLGALGNEETDMQFSPYLPLGLIPIIGHISSVAIPAIHSWRGRKKTSDTRVRPGSGLSFTSKTDFYTILLRPDRFRALDGAAISHFAGETTAFLAALQDLEKEQRTTSGRSEDIFRQFILEGAPMEVEVSLHARACTSRLISEGSVGVAVFAEARIEVEEYVYRHFFPHIPSM